VHTGRASERARNPRRRVRVLAALATGGLLVIAFATLSPVAGAKAPTCRVTNLQTAVAYNDNGQALNDAIAAATSGDTLQIKGVCSGSYTVSQKTLTLLGKGTKDVPQATLQGDLNVGVGTFQPGYVTVTNMKITGSSSSGVSISPDSSAVLKNRW
jgi:hypothetical protein